MKGGLWRSQRLTVRDSMAESAPKLVQMIFDEKNRVDSHVAADPTLARHSRSFAPDVVVWQSNRATRRRPPRRARPRFRYRRIGSFHCEAPPSGSVTAWKRIGADLVDVIETRWNALEQAAQADNGSDRSDRNTVGVVDSEKCGKCLALWAVPA